MNSLEFIEKQILFVKQNIQYHKDLLTTVEDDESIEIIKSTIKLIEPDLQTLQQIKSELEAWYVVKDKVEIKRGTIFDHVLRNKQNHSALDHDEYRKLNRVGLK